MDVCTGSDRFLCVCCPTLSSFVDSRTFLQSPQSLEKKWRARECRTNWYKLAGGMFCVLGRTIWSLEETVFWQWCYNSQRHNLDKLFYSLKTKNTERTGVIFLVVCISVSSSFFYWYYGLVDLECNEANKKSNVMFFWKEIFFFLKKHMLKRGGGEGKTEA